jgi:hypothetical protein
VQEEADDRVGQKFEEKLGEEGMVVVHENHVVFSMDVGYRVHLTLIHAHISPGAMNCRKSSSGRV